MHGMDEKWIGLGLKGEVGTKVVHTLGVLMLLSFSLVWSERVISLIAKYCCIEAEKQTWNIFQVHSMES